MENKSIHTITWSQNWRYLFTFSSLLYVVSATSLFVLLPSSTLLKDLQPKARRTEGSIWLSCYSAKTIFRKMAVPTVSFYVVGKYINWPLHTDVRKRKKWKEKEERQGGNSHLLINLRCKVWKINLLHIHHLSPQHSSQYWTHRQKSVFHIRTKNKPLETWGMDLMSSVSWYKWTKRALSKSWMNWSKHVVRS